MKNTAALPISLYGIAKSHKPDSGVFCNSDAKVGLWDAPDKPFL
jgi:hypothetical protein